MDELKIHWENIYNSKTDNEVSWFQEHPETSLNLIKKYGESQQSIIDIGGGNSKLTYQLVQNGFDNITLLDISKRALERNLERLPNANINVIEKNILDLKLNEQVHIWHDRAVFHFLTKKVNIKKYAEVVTDSVESGGNLILATFSEFGPDKCSGLPITQYSEEKFVELFEPTFKLLECFNEIHKTPFNSEQNFIWVVFKKM